MGRFPEWYIEHCLTSKLKFLNNFARVGLEHGTIQELTSEKRQFKISPALTI